MKVIPSYIRHTLMPIGLALLIFYGTCLMDTASIPKIKLTLPLDKIVHFGMFFLLAAANSYDYYRMHNRQPKKYRWIFWGVVVPSIYGGIIEVLQENYFNRSGEWADFFADILGATAGMLAVIYFLKIRKNRKNKVSL